MSARSSSAFAVVGALAAALVAVTALEQGTLARRQWQAFPPPLSRPLPPQLTRLSLAAALGDSARIAADWAYIDCLQYMGDNLNSLDGHFRQTEALYREILWLDPGFEHAVLEGATVLGWNKRMVPEAERYMQEALRYDPADQRLRLYMAALAYEKADDPVAMVEALRPEILRPDAPEMMLRIVGNVYLKESDWKDALIYFHWLSSRAREPETLQLIEHGSARAKAGLAAEGKQH